MPPQLDQETIQAAIEGYEQQRNRIDEKLRELRSMQSGRATTAETPRRGRGRSRLSPEARARIAAAQRARWAKMKGQLGESKPAAPAKKKRRLSKEGRARIIAATKARWARARAEKEQAGKKTAAK